MTVSVPEVEAVALKLKHESDLVLNKSAETDVSNDYGTPNVLFLYYIPFLPDDKKLDLDAIQDEFQTWNAWELRQAETQLNKHVKAGSLPSDDSIASRVARNNYRSKAIDFFRAGSEAWLSLASNKRGKKSFETTQDGVNGAILQGLRALATEHHQLQSQFGVVLNAISGSINAEQENKFYFTHVYYKYDSDSRRFLPVVLDTTFTVMRKGGGSEDSEDKFSVEINLSTNTYNFDRNFWRDNRHEGEDAIHMGEPIREQMAIDFYVDG